MSFRKNVFIVGAGFSAEAGAPVIRDFFSRAMELGQDPSSLLQQNERGIFQKVSDYRQALFEAEAKVQIDLDNIEDLFGVVEMGSQLGESGSQEMRKNLVYVILRTIELTATGAPQDGAEFLFGQGTARQGAGMPGDIYDFFVSVVGRRWLPRPESGVARDTIITLNYDLLLEQAMADNRLAPQYDLPAERIVERIAAEQPACRLRFLKLHGSANWTFCSACKDKIYLLSHLESSVSEEVTLPKCHSCHQPANARLIVPPTWNKEESRPLLMSVWQSAVRELESAQRIFVIGYSMPETDKFFQYLLALALHKNKTLHEVAVVNRNGRDAERIAKLFRRLYERQRTSQQQSTFRDWVRTQGFQNQVRQQFPSKEFAW